ncbi:hypothetical protein ABZ606_05865 [Streptomyces sp. NPDC012461]|uniref:Uncharacterized protein n=2 Tax=unclassified Streptomyces TaxID=2593676 RepID=A0A6G3QYV0_9ACTN|nr:MULTISPECIES: hypothetical protein [unclassified Streptomyces]MBM7090603.1 hypothetical protein [Streptomyces sp. S12]NEA88360.1 hypothetical protein [Streptomyces sp. SID14436]NEC81744.1 hypothetical protein [Streptomyces sp. SID7958]
MPAPESAPEAQARSRSPQPSRGVSMHELLASCAAATAVSTPPRAPEPQVYGTTEERGHREAA